jgi:SPP1 gp7 family putative phage head morphogenesis protein
MSAAPVTAIRTLLLQREHANATVLLRAYRGIADRIEQSLALLLAEIGDTPPTVNQLRRMDRYRALLDQVTRGIDLFAAVVERRVTTEQAAVLRLALDHAAAQVEQALPIDTTFNRLPFEAVSQLVGTTTQDTPLARLLSGFGDAAAQRAADALSSGLALGRAPRIIAQDLRKALNVSAVRGLTIARTEVLGAFRRASLAAYVENSDILRGWRWSAARDARVCDRCRANDGKVYDLDVPFTTHPNCRCSPLPVLKDRLT